MLLRAGGNRYLASENFQEISDVRADCQEISDVGKTRKYHHRWDDVSVLDADHIASWGAYEPGALELVGFDDDKPVPSLTYELQESGDRFRAFYEYKPRDGGDGFPVRSTVYLERRPCRFGGHRVYFIAPCCTRRVLRLAALSSGLKCGDCGKLTYDTKRKSPAARQVDGPTFWHFGSNARTGLSLRQSGPVTCTDARSIGSMPSTRTPWCRP